jgi:type I restriction enzyme S subunit
VKTIEGWDKKALRDLATINYGKSPIEILVPDGPYPVVGTGGIERLGNDYLYEGESIILGRKGTIDRVHFATGRFWAIDTAYYLSDFAESVPLWLFYFLQTIDLRQMNEATGVPSLSRDALYKIEVPTPPKPEQTKIAEILSTVDRAIEQTEALIAKQQRIKTGLMQDLLTRGIDEHGNLRSEETHQFKDSPIGRIPLEWEIKDFFDCVSISEGQRDPRQSPYLEWTLVAPDHIESRTGLLVSRNTARDQGAISGKYEFGPDDIIYSKIRPYLRKAVLVDFKGLCSADMYPLKSKDGVMPEFLFATVLGERFSRYAESVSERSGFPKINRAELSEFQIALPSEEEQGRIAEFTRKLSKSSGAEYATFAKLRSLKTALMQHLLTGKKRVTPLLTKPQEAVE